MNGRQKNGSMVLGVRSQNIVLLVGSSALFCILVQLALGASGIVVAMVAITVGLGLAGFAAVGPYCAGGWLLLCYVLGNVLVALYAKTLFGQTIESHLYEAEQSFYVVMLSTAALFLALMMTRRLSVGAAIFRKMPDEKTLSWLSWGCFGLGVTAWFVNQHFQTSDSGGFGGLAVFRQLLLMAVVARTALVFIRGENRTMPWDYGLLVIVGGSVTLGLLENHKLAVALPVVSYFATVLFFRRGLPMSQIIVLLAGAAFFIVVATPMIQAWRYLGQQNMSVEGRAILMVNSMAELWDGAQFKHFKALGKRQFRGGYYNYFGGGGRGQMLLGRFASIQQVDPVIAYVDRGQRIGGVAIFPAFERLVPRVLYPNKPEEAEAYRILRTLGIIGPGAGKYPTLPLVGQAYAAYGEAGALIIPFCTFFVFLLFLKKVGWILDRNIYAIFLFCDFIAISSSQGDMVQYAGMMLRDFPLFWVTFTLLDIASKVRWRDFLDRAVRRPGRDAP